MKNDAPEERLELALAELAESLSVAQRALAHFSTAFDDAQLANVDLQVILQKQQQLLQLLSNISKILWDTVMAIVRKTSG